MKALPDQRYRAETIRETHRRLRDVLPEETHLGFDESGWWMVLEWGQGPGLDEVRSLLAPDPTGRWEQEDEGASWYTEKGEVHFRRHARPRAVAYAVMGADSIDPCPCKGGSGGDEESITLAREVYTHAVQVRDGENLEKHPHLLASGIPAELLERMQEMLLALTEDEEESVSIEEAYCRVGHLEGLRQLTLAVEA